MKLEINYTVGIQQDYKEGKFGGHKKWVSVESLKKGLLDAIRYNESITAMDDELDAFRKGMLQAQKALLDELEKTE
jgi:hypothetical protein